MQSIVTDLHLHSKYSRAVSPQMEIPEMSRQAQRKGINLLATGDWTHPAWFAHLEEELEEWQPGIYISRQVGAQTKFLLSTEISCIYSQGGKVRRIHVLVFSPSLDVCRKIIQALAKRGAKLASDGRPVIGMSCIQLSELVFGVDERCMIIPAHAWTPWFGVYGSKGGFDSLAEAFGPYLDKIVAIETGLSSDPAMNWRVSELDNRAILSWGDAHSPSKMGREVTVLVDKTAKLELNDALTAHLAKNDEFLFTYGDVVAAFSEPFLGKNSGKLQLAYSVEYYPEEGKYHWDGHRACNFVQPPAATRKLGTTCPVCGKGLTIGVEYRVEELATNENKPTSHHLPMGQQYLTFENRLPYLRTIPLIEIISQVEGKAVTSKAVVSRYELLVSGEFSEFEILFQVSAEKLTEIAGAGLAFAIGQVRKGEVEILPGFDGQYGTVHLTKPTTEIDQLGLF
jgi:PHP family Zn ribbon phosphoesterase